MLNDHSNLLVLRNSIQKSGVCAIGLEMQTPFVRNILIFLKPSDGSVSKAWTKSTSEMEVKFA